MQRGRKTVQIITGAAIFIMMEIAALNMLQNNSELQGIWISRISHTVMARAWGGSENIKHYLSLKKENELLSEENSRLSQQLQAFKDKENAERCDSLTRSIVRHSDFRYTPAAIIKMSRNRQHNYFIINKGYEDGVSAQSGIITNNGVIGIIDAVDRNCSYGITLMNTGLNISSRIGNEGAVGPLSWDGRSADKALLKEIPLQFKFSPGDTVWTSGYSAIFPPDIPIGRIEDSKIVNGAVNEIEVRLFENFSALRYVTIVENVGRDEIISLENLEQKEEK